MSETLLRKYVEERETLSDLITNTLGRADAEGRDLVDAEVESLTATKERLAEVDRQMSQIKDAMESRSKVVDVQHLMHSPAPVARDTAQFQINEPAPTIGDFVDSPEFRNWGGYGSSGRYEVNERASVMLRAPLAEGSSPGSLLLPNKQKFVAPQGTAVTPLLDSVGRISVSSNAIDLVVYGDVKGATGFDVVAEGAAKPEATIVASTKTVNIPTVAAWIAATRQLLEDAPAARSLIEGQLRLGYIHKLESLCSTAIAGGTYTKTTGASKQPLIEVVREGVATVEAAGFRPNAILTSPSNAASFDLTLYSKTLLGAAMGANVWGLQIIPVPGLTKTYVGDFQTGIAWLERTQSATYITDSHADLFIKNTFVILHEGRSAFEIIQPAAITEIALTA